VKEVRWHWENKVPLSCVASDSQVNLNYAILYQKLHLVSNHLKDLNLLFIRLIIVQ
jgi:hypothetical protein